MIKLELFPSLVDRCLQEPCGRSRPLFALMNPCCAKCVNQLYDFCVSLSCTCCGNALETSHMTSRVCVCVRMNFSAIYRLVPCLWIRASQSINWPKCHNKTGSFERHPKTTGAIFSCSSKASNSSIQKCAAR